MAKTKKIKFTQIKTFLFEIKNKPYSDDIINKWLFDHKFITENIEIIWDIQDNYVFVTITYVHIATSDELGI